MRHLALFACLFFFACGNTTRTPLDTCIDVAKIDPDAACPMNYDPVCGCDDKTYSNACMAINAGVTTYTTGACKENTTAEVPEGCIDPSREKPTGCPDLYNPVCGCDDKTYANDCAARVAGVVSWKPGACK